MGFGNEYGYAMGVPMPNAQDAEEPVAPPIVIPDNPFGHIVVQAPQPEPQVQVPIANMLMTEEDDTTDCAPEAGA